MPDDCETCGTDYQNGGALDLGALPLCETGASAAPADRVTRLLLTWLRFHFSSAGLISDPALRARIWRSDASTPIVIDTLARYDPASDNGGNPCLLVERSDQQRYGDAETIAGVTGGLGAGTGYETWTPMIGTHAVFCTGGREGEAEALAAEVFLEASGFCVEVLASGLAPFLRFRPTGVAARRPLPGPKEIWTVPVMFEYHYVIKQLITRPTAPPLVAAYANLISSAFS